MEQPLVGVRVLDFGMAGVGPISAEWMGMLGADVIKIESPTGDIVRRGGHGGKPGWAGHTFLGQNIGKRGIILDLKQDGDRATALQLVKTADVLLENFRSPEVLERLGLGWEVISKVNPRLIYLQSSAFGSVGPQVGKASSDPVAQAFGGAVSVTGQRNGRPEFSRGTMALDFNGAMVNTEAMLIGLYVRNRTGKGLKINTSQYESTLIGGTTRIAEYLATGTAPGPMGSGRTNIVPDQAFAAADGFFTVTAPNDRTWRRLCTAIGRMELASDGRFATPYNRVTNRAVLVPLLEETFRTKPIEAWVQRLRAARVPVGKPQDTETLTDALLADPQVRAEELVGLLPQTGGGEFLSQKPHWRFDKTEPRIGRPAPGHGEHQAEVLAELAAWKPSVPTAVVAESGRLALEGLRVVDFSQGISGPLAAMQLGDLGADVVKIEPPEGDWMRAIPPFQGGEGAIYLQLNRNKRSAAVDLKAPEGVALAKRLVAQADIVVEGYTTGVMQRLGLDYETLSKGNPRLIYCSISGWGSRGPLAGAPATELDIQAAVGATRHVGPLEGELTRYGYDLASVSGGMAGVQGILTALIWREQSGLGQHVETSLLAAEIAVHQFAFDAERHPEDRGSKGYLGPRTPQDFGFETADGPTLLGARDYDRGWVPLLKALGLGHLLEDERFATREALNSHTGDLVTLVNPVLSKMTFDDVQRLIDDHAPDATSTTVLDVGEVAENEQTRALNAITTMEGHPTAGSLRVVAPPWRFTGALASLRLRPPLLGEHTAEVAREAGYSGTEIERLAARGTLIVPATPVRA